jgi:gliding motility-associated-like protein
MGFDCEIMNGNIKKYFCCRISPQSDMQIVRAILCAAVILCLHYRANAQTCKGSLGDPVAHITFGTGTGPGFSLPAFQTPYRYSPNVCPTDGQYTIINNVSNCFNNTWHAVQDDHTPGDVSGYYMLVNGAFVPGDFYRDTIRGLCGNTLYQLSAWFLNILMPGNCSGSPVLPNITITVETPAGGVLATYNTGDLIEIQRPQWRDHAVYFTMPTGASTVVVRFASTVTGGCGNEFAMDDIIVRPCGDNLNAMLAAGNASAFDICEGDNRTVQLTSTFAGVYANPVYQWQVSNDLGVSWSDIPGAKTTSFLRTATRPGIYYYRLTVAESGNGGSLQCRLASNPVTISVNALPNAQVTNYVYGCYGSTVILFAAGGNTYTWKGPNGFTSNTQQADIPDVKFTDAGQYEVLVTDYKGCSRTASTILNVYPAATAVKGPDVSFCEGDSSMISVSGGVRYKWLPAANLSNDTIPTPVARPADSTIYRAVVISDHGCTDTALIHVNVWKKPKAIAGPDKRMRQGFSVLLDGQVTGTDVSFNWAPSLYMSGATSLHPTVAPPGDFQYELQAVSDKGCGVSTDLVRIRVYDKISVPNAFSPNGDGINDTWIIEPLELFAESVTEVFNRHGQVVYRSNGYFKPWNGTRNGQPLPVGTYYYSIVISMNEPRITGWVTIIR